MVMGELRERHSWRKEKKEPSLWHRLNGEHKMNKSVFTLSFTIPLILIILVLSSSLLFFHRSMVNIDDNSQLATDNDPSTPIWSTTSKDDYRLFRGTGSSTDISLTSNSTHTAIALSKNTVGDLSIAGGKLLQSVMVWSYFNGTCCGSSPTTWGWYLTRNSTLPTEAGYSPGNDKSVAMMVSVGSLGGGSYGYNLYIQKRQSESINSEDTGNCNGGGSAFLCQSSTFDPTTFWIITGVTLNYTGSSVPTSCGISGSNNGCSSFDIIRFIGALTNTVVTGTFPPFNFQSIQYYMGMFSIFNLPFSPRFKLHCTSGNTDGCSGAMTIISFLDVATVVVPSSTYDSGGFFGSVGKALGGAWNTVTGTIGGAVGNVIGPIINLGSGLLTVFISALAQSLGLFVQQLKLFLNTVGGWFGIGNVGDSIINFFIGIGSFFISVIGGGFSILDELASEGNKIITAIINFFSNGLSIFNFVNDFLNSMSGLWNIIIGGWNEFLHWYTIGSMSISYFLVLWYFFGIYQVYLDGIHGLKSWLDMSEMFLLSIFKAGYWFSKESFNIVLTIKQLVAGWV